MLRHLISLARAATGPFPFRKRLPRDFGLQRIVVTSRADIRLLAPGLERAAGDLFTVVRRYVRPGDVVWDIGSNLGALTFSAALRAGPRGHVFSVEADPRYADLQTRTQRGLTAGASPVTVLCAAVADSVGVLDLVVPHNGHARSHLASVEGNGAAKAEVTKTVVTLTLDWLLERWPAPAFVKIDVEGAELLVVLGADRLFSDVRPTAYVECSEANAGPMTDFFLARDYRLFALSPAGDEVPTEQFVFNTVVRPREACG